MRGYGRFLALLAAALLLGGAAAAQTRGLTLKIKASEARDAPVAGEVRLYKSSYALVIGIDDYTGGWPRLSNAVKDAELVAEELGRQGFAVTLKRNLGSVALKRAFEEFYALKGDDPDARLFVWFAGHGHSEVGEGFLVPADAPHPKVGGQFRLSALSMRRFGEYVRLARSRHALAVFDACFAGTVFTSQRALPPVAVTRATTLPVRQFLTSGDAGQTVSDDGTFRELFLRALRGEEKADANDDGYLTGSELGLYLTDRLTNLTDARQTPRYGKLRDKDYDRGDFVFALAAPPPPRTSTSASPTAPTGMTAEMMFWQSMKDSTNAADLQDYLDRFPNGNFTGLAKRRLAALTPEIPTGPSPDTIREAQRLLKGLGYDPGVADGRMGGNTRKAIESFQRSHDLTVDGSVTDALIANLKVARKQVAAVRPAPAPATAPSPAKPAVGVYPDRYKPGDVFKDCAGCPEMVVIPAGSFAMGSPAGEEGRDGDEGPVHRVTIARPFAVGKFEVTQGQWRAVMGTSPSYFKGERNPVERVSWNAAKEFTRKLSARTGKEYRLLTEAEWEYAARARTTTPFHFGSTIGPDQANYNGNYSYAGGPKGVYRKKTVPVGSFPANSFGLHDVHGNVWEWVEDCWHGSYSGAPTNGGAWTTGGECGRRVLRGGSWFILPWYVRAAFRNRLDTDLRIDSYGFRVARTF